MAITGIDSSVVSAYYNGPYLSVNSAVVKPQVYKTMFQQYGPGLTLLQWVRSAEKVVDVPWSSYITAIEQQSPLAAIKIGAAIATGDEGADITIVLHDDNYDANDYNPVRLYDTILIPAEYQPATVYTSRLYQVVTRATDANPYDTLTCRPFAADGTYVTDSQISTEVPTNSWLALGYTPYARGTGQPAGKTVGYTSRSHYPFLLKETDGIEGSVIATDFYEAAELNGKFLSKALAQAEFRFEKQKDMAFSIGEYNDNALLVMTSDFGGSNKIQSGKGVVTWADELAQKYTYDKDTGFVVSEDFDAIKIILESRGVTAPVIDWFVGSDLNTQVENSGLDFIREFSGGTNLKVGDTVGIMLSAFQKIGKTFNLVPVASFTNPADMGLLLSDNYVYEYPTLGIMIPQASVTMKQFADKQNFTIPTLALGEVNYGGENRGNILARLKGPNGVFEGIDVATDSDGFFYYWMANFFTIVGGVQQWVVTRQAKS